MPNPGNTKIPTPNNSELLSLVQHQSGSTAFGGPVRTTIKYFVAFPTRRARLCFTVLPIDQFALFCFSSDFCLHAMVSLAGLTFPPFRPCSSNFTRLSPAWKR